MTDFTGQEIDKYILKDLIHRGNDANVYLCEHLDTHKKAVIKIFHLQSADVLTYAQKEFDAMKQLGEYPHIVRVYGSGIWKQHMDTYFYVVMEYAAQGSLRRLLVAGKPLPVLQVILYVGQIASALQFAHGRNIVHRDVKPDNILLRNEWETCLADFGIVGIVDEPPGSLTRSRAGTPRYMPPEQNLASKAPSVDQYALAVVAYECLTGTVFTGPAPPLRQIRSELPQVMEDVVMRALSLDPKNRFLTVMEFAQRLQQAASSPYDVATAISSHVPTILPVDPFATRVDQNLTAQPIPLTPTQAAPTVPDTLATGAVQPLSLMAGQAPSTSKKRSTRVLSVILAMLALALIVAGVFASLWMDTSQREAQMRSQIPGTATVLTRSLQITQTTIARSLLTDFDADRQTLKLDHRQPVSLENSLSDGKLWSNSPGQGGSCSFPGHGYQVMSEVGTGYTCASKSSYPANLAIQVHAFLSEGDTAGITTRLARRVGVKGSSLRNYYSFRLTVKDSQGTVKFFSALNAQPTSLNAKGAYFCSTTPFPLNTDFNNLWPDYTLGIITVGSQINMYVNGKRVCSVSNGDVAEGGEIGLAAGPGPGDALRSTPPTQVTFHYLEYWTE